MFTPKRPTYRATIQTHNGDQWIKVAKDVMIWTKGDGDNPKAPDIHTAKFQINGVTYTLSAWKE